MEEDELNQGIYEGYYSVLAVPLTMVTHTFDAIWFPVKEQLAKATTIDKFVKYANSVNLFSEAKGSTNVLELSMNLFDESGNKRAFKDFAKIAQGINKKYNLTYLNVEQQTAIEVVDSIAKWNQIESSKNEYPYLRYYTMGDGSVRPSHAAWNGIIKPVDDPFWNTHMPPNGWNCRCKVRRQKTGSKTDLKTHLKEFNTEQKELGLDQIKSLENDSDLFNVNFAKENYIFSPKSSYFKTTKKHKSKYVRF